MTAVNAGELSAQNDGRPAGPGYYRLRCPAHSGMDRNLSIWDGTDGRVGAKCHSHNCSYRDIMAAFGIETRGRSRHPPCPACGKSSEFLEALYEHPPSRGKRCVHRRPCGGPGCDWPDCDGRAGKHVWGPGSPKGCLVLLWGEDREGDALVVVEGEKAAQALLRFGLEGVTPVSWRGGAGKESQADWSPVKGRRLVLWPDNDSQGRLAMAQVALLARAAGATEIRDVDPAELPAKADAADVTAERARELIDAATAATVDGSTDADPDDPWGVTDATFDAWCGRTLRRHAAKLLAVRDERDEVELLIDNGHGVWRRSLAGLEALLAETMDAWLPEAVKAAGDIGKAKGVAAFAYQGQQRKRRETALQSASRVLATWTAAESLPPELTVARVDEVDADGRYLGTPNGVVDLDTGKLLTGAAARRCLVTRVLPDCYDPEARSPDVDKLLAHLSTAERRWLLEAFGFALRGTPSRRIYVLKGPTGGGKSTLFKAVAASLGEHADAVEQRTLLAPNRGTSNTGPTPENERWTDRRILVCSEPVTGKLDWVGLKAKSGGDALPFRRLYMNYDDRKRYAMATLFLAANPETLPMPPLRDEALYERVRVLEYPQVPERDPGLEGRLPHDPEARQALAALLIRHARSPSPPEDVPSVAAARAALLEESLGDAGRWARDLLVAEAEARVTTQEIWDAALEAAEEGLNSDTAWGLNRQRLLDLVKSTHGLGNADRWKDSDNKTRRGWKDWKLAVNTVPDSATRDQGAAWVSEGVAFPLLSRARARGGTFTEVATPSDTAASDLTPETLPELLQNGPDPDGYRRDKHGILRPIPKGGE